jgi:peptidoglycan/xylan/chitin deacetylase (PgdA/CDA1 family)
VTMLRDADIDLISLDEMHRRLVARDFTRRFACLTFDDGYRDSKEWAYPILKRHEVPFAIYVPTSFPDRLGRLWWLMLEQAIANARTLVYAAGDAKRALTCGSIDEKHRAFVHLYGWLRSLPTNEQIVAAAGDIAARYGVDAAALCERHCMSWNEIAELAKDPLVTVGAHTVNHVILAKSSESAARTEMKMGRAVLHAALGTLPQHFSYPFGDAGAAGPREFRLAREIGYKTAVTTRPGMLLVEHAHELGALPRLSINGEFQRTRYVQVLMSGTGTGVWDRMRRLNVA